MSNATGRFASLALWERCAIIALLLTFIVFGGIVVKRSSLRWKPKGDFGVYARAAWAVRAGDDLREATCDHGWHYTYPPTLAVLLMPLAKPPLGVESAGTLPYELSCTIWYLINLACLIVAVHTLVSALEFAGAIPLLREQPARCRSWWQLRLWPALACAPVVGQTLSRGQVNLIILALVCGFLSATLRGRPLRAGFFVAGAICLKIIPAFLLLVPLWRRDHRCLVGCAIGLVVIGLFTPMLGLGVQGTLHDYGEFYSSVIAPGLGYGKDDRMASELTSITCGHSQSPMSMIHTWLHPVRHVRPTAIAPWVRLAHFAFGGSLVAASLAAAMSLFGWRRGAAPAARPIVGLAAWRLTMFLGALLLTMLILSPMCHAHYLCLAIPLFTGLMLYDWHRHGEPRISRGLFGLMFVNLLATTIIMLPADVLLEDMGLGGMITLLVWGVGTATLWQMRHEADAAAPQSPAESRNEIPSPHWRQRAGAVANTPSAIAHRG